MNKKKNKRKKKRKNKAPRNKLTLKEFLFFELRKVNQKNSKVLHNKLA